MRTQTSPFPQLSNIERSWEQNIRAALDLLAAGSGVRSGLELSPPVTESLQAVLSNGYISQGDQVVGPYGSLFKESAPASATNRAIYFGLRGMYYAGVDNQPETPADILIGTLSTSATDVIHAGQQYNYGAARFGVRGEVKIAAAAKGADVPFFSWAMPDTGLKNVRISYAQARVKTVAGGVGDAGDDFVLKVKQGDDAAIALCTLDDAVLATAGASTAFIPASDSGVSWSGIDALTFLYNQTDTATAIEDLVVEVHATLELL